VLASKKSELVRGIDSTTHRIERNNANINALQKDLQKGESTLVELRSKYMATQKQVYEAGSCLTCPAFGHECKDATALAKHEDNANKAAEAHANDKARALAEINEKGIAIKDSLSTLAADIAKVESENKEFAAELEKAKGELSDVEAQIKKSTKATPQEVDPKDVPKWVALEAKAVELEKQKEVEPDKSAEDLATKKRELSIKVDMLRSQLSDRDTIKRLDKTIAELNEEAKDLAQQIADVEGLEFTAVSFNSLKIEALEARVNAMFDGLQFELFHHQINGGVKETCKAVNAQGVPEASFSTSERAKAGLQIIEVLNGFYEARAPIFIDNAEGVNEFEPSQNQMILLKVSEAQVIEVQTI